VRRKLFSLLASLFVPLVLLGTSANSAASSRPARHDIDHVVISASTRAFRADAARVGLSEAQLRSGWQSVATCEVGGNWSMIGSKYSGIGFLNTTWHEYGGDRFAPLAGHATETQQIVIAMAVTGGWIPDQSGCSPGGW